MKNISPFMLRYGSEEAIPDAIHRAKDFTWPDVSKNPFSKPEHKDLANAYDDSIERKTDEATNAKTPKELISHLSSHIESVYHAALKNPNMSDDQLDEHIAFNNTNGYNSAKHSIMMNHSLKPRHLKQFLAQDWISMQAQALQHPNANQEIFDMGLQHSSPYLQKIARACILRKARREMFDISLDKFMKEVDGEHQ
jgi:hypothetical protein